MPCSDIHHKGRTGFLGAIDSHTVHHGEEGGDWDDSAHGGRSLWYNLLTHLWSRAQARQSQTVTPQASPCDPLLWLPVMSFTLRLQLPQFHKLRPKCSNCGGHFMLKPCKIFISLAPRCRSSLPAAINTRTPFYWPNSTFPPHLSSFFLLPIPGVN